MLCYHACPVLLMSWFLGHMNIIPFKILKAYGCRSEVVYMPSMFELVGSHPTLPGKINL